MAQFPALKKELTDTGTAKLAIFLHIVSSSEASLAEWYEIDDGLED